MSPQIANLQINNSSITTIYYLYIYIYMFGLCDKVSQTDHEASQASEALLLPATETTHRTWNNNNTSELLTSSHQML